VLSTENICIVIKKSDHGEVIMKFLLILLTLNIFSIGSAFSFSGIEHTVKTNVIINQYQEELEITFFSHYGVNISEFIEGRDTVKSVINQIIANGFSPKSQSINVGIAPQTMSGGNVVISDKNTLYVAYNSPRDQIERKVLNFFVLKGLNYDKINFFFHNESTMNEFEVGVINVKNVIKKIIDSNFQWNIKTLSIGIAPSKSMSGGNVVESSGMLYISFDSSEDEIERALLKFFKY
jgi:hypothetical protein